MSAIAGTAALEQRLERLTLPLALVLPGGRRIGAADAAVTLRLNDLAPLAHLVTGQIGKVGEDYVEGRVDFDGSMRDLMAMAAELIGDDPTRVERRGGAAVSWWQPALRHGAVEGAPPAAGRRRADPVPLRRLGRLLRAVAGPAAPLFLRLLPRRRHDARAGAGGQARPHLPQADAAAGERFLDIGAGWGGLLLWAAEHYGVQAHGITLSRNQHAYVNRLIEERGLAGRVTMDLLDYRELPEDEPFDKIASVGMFEQSAAPSCRPTSPRSTACSSRAAC